MHTGKFAFLVDLHREDNEISLERMADRLKAEAIKRELEEKEAIAKACQAIHEGVFDDF